MNRRMRRLVRILLVGLVACLGSRVATADSYRPIPANWWAGDPTQFSHFDINGDGVLDSRDYQALRVMVASGYRPRSELDQLFWFLHRRRVTVGTFS